MNNDQSNSKASENQFVRQVLAKLERAERLSLIKLWIARACAISIAVWLFAFPRHQAETFQQVAAMVVWMTIFLGFCLGIALARILYVMNKNTRTVLRAIQEMREEKSSALI